MEYTINTIQPKIDDDHKDVLWYGGRVAEVEYKGYTFILGAYGDVIATLLNKEYNDEIAYSRDKQNSGRFYEEMRGFITNDKELSDLEDEGRLVLENNNWWEVLIDGPDGQQHDIGWVINSCDYDEAIQEMIDGMDEVIVQLEKPRLNPEILNTILEDDGTPNGGTSFTGETVFDFLLSVGDDSIKTIDELNAALKENGIKPVEG